MKQLTDPAVLRLLDANANRAREGLRVLEDYARFVLDDDAIVEQLKGYRHQLRTSLAGILAPAILARNTPGDVGTQVKTKAEFTREGLADVVTAAGKRLGEALRCLEEYAKTIDPRQAAKLEAVRYSLYDVEQTLALTLRPAGRFANVRLYVLITESICALPWYKAAEAAIAGGADCLQLREKSIDSGELLKRARKLVALCRKHRVLSIVNDRPDIALLSGADGVHVGQTDLPARSVRQILGPDKIVGVSTHCLDHAKQALRDGADYIGVGPIYPSSTKKRDFTAGLTYAREVTQTIPLPGVAISGITPQNAPDVAATGIQAIAVTQAVVGAKDPAKAARALRKLLANPVRSALRQ